MIDPSTPIWLLGGGNMGGALAARWLAGGFSAVEVIDPLATLPGVTMHRAPPPIGVPEILVLAVKPQLWRDAVAPFAARIGAATLVVSVMAGPTAAALAGAFPASAIVRAMPNTPARLGQGVTALWSAAGDAGGAGGDDGEAAIRQRAAALFAPAGAVVWLDAEADFDAVTGLSGSGPAYVFAMIEALGSAGEAAGLAPALAAQLALATVAGAAALAAEGTGTPAQLRAAVTSPNGTTAAGLAVLLPGLETLMMDTVAAAAARSGELAAKN